MCIGAPHDEGAGYVMPQNGLARCQKTENQERMINTFQNSDDDVSTHESIST